MRLFERQTHQASDLAKQLHMHLQMLRPTAALAICFLVTCLFAAGTSISSIQALHYIAVWAVMLFAALVDIRSRIVPHLAVGVLLLCGFVDICLQPVVLEEILVSLVGRLGISLLFVMPVLALSLLLEHKSTSSLGMGDIKLLFALGFCFGLETSMAILVFSCMVAVSHQILCFVKELFAGKRGSFLSRTMPFVPYMAIATWVVCVLGLL